MTKTFAITALCATSAFAAVKVRDNTQLHPSEVWTPEQEKAAGIVSEDLGGIERPHMLEAKAMPADFTWCNKDGVNFCTRSLNQHIPQYWILLGIWSPFCPRRPHQNRSEGQGRGRQITK